MLDTLRAIALLLLTVLGPSTACGGASPAPAPPRQAGAEAEADAVEEDEVDAEALFRGLEERLLGADSIRIRSRITARGVIAADLSGEAVIAGDGRAAITFDGDFDGSLAALRLTSDGGLQSGGNLGGETDSLFAEATAPELTEGLIIGLTRMGLLHNLARLSGGQPPDHTDGTAREWVTASATAVGPRETVGGVPTWPLTLAITVGGEPAAEATLWLSTEGGLPLRRRQVVRFEEGEMTVEERYELFELDVDLSDQAFDVGSPGCSSARRGSPPEGESG